MDVSVIIPAYNEEKGIVRSIDDIIGILEKNNLNYEIIVINDGSTDNTGQLALEKGAKVITHDFNHGYGASIKAGVRRAKYEIVLITDADGTYPATEIPNILRHIESYDMVVGARVGSDVKISPVRKPAKWALTKLANYLSESNIIDLNSGLRAMKKDVFLKFNKFLPDGFSLTSTITLAMVTGGCQVKYVPISYRRRIGKSKIRPIRDTLNFLQLIIRAALLFNPLKIFLPIGLMLLFAGIFVFFYSLYFLPYALDITAVVLFVAGIQILAIGMIADLINKRF
jgi:glycosyltransferase involved in cell wall biosynthesis